MASQPQTVQRYDFDFGPAFKMYMENIEKWRKTCEQMAQAPERQSLYSAEPAPANYDKVIGQWQKGGENFFRRFVEQQIELCRFFEKRWEQYLMLPDQIAHCRTPMEFSQMQIAFMNQLASDYVRESGKLLQPMNELVAGWTPGD